MQDYPRPPMVQMEWLQFLELLLLLAVVEVAVLL
jgi:hypothetical protein